METEPKNKTSSLVNYIPDSKIKYEKLSVLARRQLDILLKKLCYEQSLTIGSNPERYKIKITQLLQTEGAIQPKNKK